MGESFERTAEVGFDDPDDLSISCCLIRHRIVCAKVTRQIGFSSISHFTAQTKAGKLLS
jgi:hypothetical protein